jgi:hypothetical protein
MTVEEALVSLLALCAGVALFLGLAQALEARPPVRRRRRPVRPPAESPRGTPPREVPASPPTAEPGADQALASADGVGGGGAPARSPFSRRPAPPPVVPAAGLALAAPPASAEAGDRGAAGAMPADDDAAGPAAGAEDAPEPRVAPAGTLPAARATAAPGASEPPPAPPAAPPFGVEPPARAVEADGAAAPAPDEGERAPAPAASPWLGVEARTQAGDPVAIAPGSTDADPGPAPVAGPVVVDSVEPRAPAAHGPAPDGAADPGDETARAAVAASVADEVARRLRAREWRDARRVADAAAARGDVDPDRAQALDRLIASAVKREVERLVTPAIRGARDERRAVHALAEAEALLAGLAAEVVPAAERVALGRRVAWARARVGIQRVRAGRLADGLDALGLALARKGLGPERLRRVRETAAEALDAMAAAAAAAAAQPDGHAAAAALLHDLEAAVARARAAGVPPRLLAPVQERAGRLAAELAPGLAR